MAFVESKVKTPVGMQTLDFWPITAEPENSHPTYGEKVNLGAAVKGYVSVTTASSSFLASLPRSTAIWPADNLPLIT